MADLSRFDPSWFALAVRQSRVYAARVLDTVKKEQGGQPAVDGFTHDIDADAETDGRLYKAGCNRWVGHESFHLNPTCPDCRERIERLESLEIA